MTLISIQIEQVNCFSQINVLHLIEHTCSGIVYGLHPIIILAPSLSAGMHWDPMVIGVEISDSGHLGIWEKERRGNLGPSKLSGETQF